jgi:hypothetical protein
LKTLVHQLCRPGLLKEFGLWHIHQQGEARYGS